MTTRRAVASELVREGESPVCEHFQRAAEIVARRWTPQIVRVLLQGPARYRDLRAAIPTISDHLLSERLKELEAAGIVTRSQYLEVPPRVEYELTDRGRGLRPVIAEMERWGRRWSA